MKFLPIVLLFLVGCGQKEVALFVPYPDQEECMIQIGGHTYVAEDSFCVAVR